MSDVKCIIKHCRNEVDIFYYGRPLCDKHWDKLSLLSVSALKKKLGIKKKDEPINIIS